MMNLPQFLRAVDAAVSEMNLEEARACLHELARTTSESRRARFLEVVRSAGPESGKCESQKRSADPDTSDLKAQVGSVIEKLQGIKDGERCLDSEYNEDWDDWYDNDEDEVIFTDPEGLLPDIEDAIQLIHQCVDSEVYEVGCHLAEELSCLQIEITGDYDGYYGSSMPIRGLYEEHLIDGAFSVLVRESLYLCYMGNEPEDRADALYRMMFQYHCFDVRLEEIMQMGSGELPDFDGFLPQWISCLGEKTGSDVKNALLEAQLMMEDDAQQLEIARRYAETYPELYLQLLQKNPQTQDLSELIQIGREALDRVPVFRKVRADIALAAASLVCQVEGDSVNNNEPAENEPIKNGRVKNEPGENEPVKNGCVKNTCAKNACVKNAHVKMDALCAERECFWLEAFRSSTTVINYMRLRFLGQNWDQNSHEVMRICEEAFRNTEDNDYYVILFFEEEFGDVLRLGMNKRESLGWTSSFMKEGIALFLLLLFKGDTLHTGLTSMELRAKGACGFQLTEYWRGTGSRNVEASEMDLFREIFRDWKKSVQIDEEDRKKWLARIEALIKRRTAAIMQANRRSYYGECASFIAAYGEVRESLGERGAKARIMESFKKEYSRRSAFHRELRAYGMR